MTNTTHNPFDETYRVSRLRENFTSGSDGEGLETSRHVVPRQSFTRQQMFSHWKRRGFDFEITHITSHKALLGLINMIALAYLIAHQWALKLYEQKKIKKKAHGYLAKSIFRYGLDDLIHAMRMLLHGQDRIINILKGIFTIEGFVR